MTTRFPRTKKIANQKPAWLLPTLLLVACSANSKPISSQPLSDNSTQAAGPAEHRLTLADRRLWRSKLNWPDSCETPFHYQDESFGGIDVFKFSDKYNLVQVTCTLGAYQGIYRFYLVPISAQSAEAPHALTFTVFEDSGVSGPDRIEKEKTEEIGGTPHFVPTSKQLVVLDKFRGPGDCGLLTTYLIGPEATQVEEVRGHLDCDGKGAKNPAQWPKLSLGSKK